MNGVDLDGVDFEGVDLDGVVFDGVDFDGVDLDGVDLYDVDFKGVDLDIDLLIEGTRDTGYPAETTEDARLGARLDRLGVNLLGLYG